MQYLVIGVNSIAYASIVFLLGSGLLVVLGLMRIVNLLQGGYLLLGGYIAASIGYKSGALVGIVVGALTMAVVGLVSVPLVNRFKTDIQQAVATLGGLFMIESISLWIWGGTPRSIKFAGVLGGSISLGRRGVAVSSLFIVGVGVVAAAVMLVVERRTMLGSRVAAIVDDPIMAESVGINRRALTVGGFAVAGLLGGLAGGLGSVFLPAAPGSDLTALLLAVTVVVVGGLGSVLGAIVTAVAIGLLQEFGAVYFPAVAEFTTYVPLLLVLAFRPTGLFAREVE